MSERKAVEHPLTSFGRPAGYLDATTMTGGHGGKLLAAGVTRRKLAFLKAIGIWLAWVLRSGRLARRLANRARQVCGGLLVQAARFADQACGRAKVHEGVSTVGVRARVALIAEDVRRFEPPGRLKRIRLGSSGQVAYCWTLAVAINTLT